MQLQPRWKPPERSNARPVASGIPAAPAQRSHHFRLGRGNGQQHLGEILAVFGCHRDDLLRCRPRLAAACESTPFRSFCFTRSILFSTTIKGFFNAASSRNSSSFAALDALDGIIDQDQEIGLFGGLQRHRMFLLAQAANRIRAGVSTTVKSPASAWWFPWWCPAGDPPRRCPACCAPVDYREWTCPHWPAPAPPPRVCVQRFGEPGRWRA